MKVCSQCEFIYEDDQSLCDMDGAELLYDPAPRALNQVAAAASTVPLAKPRRRRLAATAVTGLFLGTVFVLLLQVLMPATQEQLSATRPQNPNYSSAADGDSAAKAPTLDIAQPVPLAPAVDVLPLPPEPAVDELPAPTPPGSPYSPSPKSTNFPERAPKANADAGSVLRPSVKALSNESARVKSSTSPQRPPSTRVAATTRKSEQSNAKPSAASREGSKIGSLLKKTGRILKKPFGF